MEAVHNKKNTVKELLMQRRQAYQSTEVDGNSHAHKLKSAKSEASPADASHHLMEPPPPPTSPANCNISTMFPPQNTSMQDQESPAAAGKMTLFHWQIQQEAQKAEGLSSEQLNMQDADGDTFLHIAVAQGRRALAYVLAAKMARCGSLDLKEHNGQTPLQIAAATNQHLIVQDLLSHGAQINTRDFWGRAPLHVCAEKGHVLSLQSIWRTLTGSGQPVDIEMFNYDGLTPLHVAVLSHNGVIKETRKLENPCSYIMMEMAQRRLMYVECIKILMHMGASSGTMDLKSGRTCLHMAAEEANVELFNVFLSQPASLSTVNIKTFSGNTALHIVSSLQNHTNQVDTVKLLMRKGADPGVRNFENELPSQLVPEGPIGEKVRQILKGKFVHA
ncbi:NF-kappa-B inhibitor zeta isoform X2 [Parambassis ranga]|nr:NF-kappa-B inhibitor zeta isoform X2 [Parambassis ranga]